MFTKDSDLDKSSKALVWTVCYLRSSLWITEVNEEHFLSLWLGVIQDEEDNLRLILTSLKGHDGGLQAEVLFLLCKSANGVQSEGKRCGTSI